MVRVAAILLAIAAVGCSRRDAPYRFRAPVLTSVRAPELRSSSRPPPAAIREQHGRERPLHSVSRAAPVRTERPATSLHERGDSTSPAALLRSRVGERIDASDVEFALSAVTVLGAQLAGEVAAARTGTELVAVAEARGAIGGARPLTGDLVVFDEVVADEEASLVGVVASVDDRGTVEFVYLSHGVVRRGFATPSRPREKRDAAGRALNTFVRRRDRRPRGAPGLGGELWRTTLRLDRLAR